MLFCRNCPSVVVWPRHAVFRLSRYMFCADRVAGNDLKRTHKVCGGILTTVSDLDEKTQGTCSVFEEVQVAGERYNLLKGYVPSPRRPPSFSVGEPDSSWTKLKDLLTMPLSMIVRRALKNDSVVAVGGSIG